MFRAFVDNSGLLAIGTVLALVWANVAHDSCEQVAHAMHFAVNDIGMALFFALAAKEVVEATAPGGALHSPRRSAVPLIAALGGMAGPALIYLGLVLVLHRTELMRGWAIPCATDIAFSLLVARLIFGPKHAGIPFLLLLAIADDALGLLILAVFYPAGELRPIEFVVILSAALAVAWWLRKRGTLTFWPYIAGAGVASWLAFYRGGLHPALALVPIMPFLPHSARDPGLFVESGFAHDTLTQFEHWWRLPVQVMLFFSGWSTPVSSSAASALARGASLPQSWWASLWELSRRRLSPSRPASIGRTACHGGISSWWARSPESASPWRCFSPRPHFPRARSRMRPRWEPS